MKPTIPEVLPLIETYRKQYGCGGPLHIFLDDQNIDNGHIEFCRQQAILANDSPTVDLCDTLMKMSKTQRLKIANR